jgi:electron transfer flavoprotein beta subunit
MKVLVAVKRVVDFNVKVRVKPDGTGVETTNVKMSINPFDEIAVEEAVRLKEKGLVQEIVVTSIGPKGSQDTLRHCLALGADRAIHVDINDPLEPLAVSKILTKIIQDEQPRLVLMGKQAIDDDCNQVGQMVAALLQWPQGTFISELNVDHNAVNVVREVDGGLETIQLQLPAILTTDLRLNTPRYATLPNIMKAKQKPLQSIDGTSLGIDIKPRLQVLKVREPEVRQGGKKVESVQELANQIRKVIA